MQRDQDLARLREVIRDTVNDYYVRHGRAKVSDIGSHVFDHYPELMAKLGAHLARKQVNKLCNDEMKSWVGLAQHRKTQFILPGMDRHLVERLPPAISIPNGDNQNDITFVVASTATKAEWIAHLDYLAKQYEGLRLAIAAVRELLVRGSACPVDTVLFSWIAANSARAE